jgi:hypothetical protein
MCWQTVSKATDFVGITDTKAAAQDEENAAYQAQREADKLSQSMSQADYSSASSDQNATQEAADYSKNKLAKISSLGRTNLTGGQGLTGKLTANTATAKRKTLG